MTTLTIRDIAVAIGRSRQAVLKRFRRGDLGPNLGGGGVFLFDPAQFTDAALRERVLARQEARARLEAKRTLAQLESELPGGNEVGWSLLDLSEGERRTARQRADFLIAAARMKRDRPNLTDAQVCARLRAIAETDRDCTFRDLLASGPRGACQIHVKALGRWRGRWKSHRRHDLDEHNWWCLADRYAKLQKARQGDERYWHQLALLYENPHQISLVDAYHAVCRRGAKDGWGDPPTLCQVKYWYARKSNKLAVKCRRQGEKFLYNVLDAPVIRDWSQVKAGDCWCSDHHLFNVFVRIPAPHAPGYWVAVRPWITQFLDVPSFHEVGWLIRAAKPNTDAVLLAWKQAVAELGWCASAIYFDNGKDYRTAGVAKMALDEARAAGVAKELGVRSIFALPFNARAKPCELDFSETEQKFERPWTTYCGHDKAHMDMLWPILKKERLATHGGDPQSSPLAGCLINPDLVPTLEEFAAAYRKFRLEEREEKTSDGIMLNGQSPRQCWETGLATLSRPKLSAEQIHLAFLLPTRELVRVKPGGVVVYRPPGGTARDAVRYQSDALLPYLVGKEQLLMKIDVADMSRCYVYRFAGQDHGWVQIKAEGAFGGVPAMNAVPALTGHEQVRVATRANRARRKLVRAAHSAEEVQQALEELRRPLASDTETRLEQGIYTLRPVATAERSAISEQRSAPAVGAGLRPRPFPTEMELEAETARLEAELGIGVEGT